MARDRWAMGASESREELGALDAPGTVKGPKSIVCLLHAFSVTFSCILSGLNQTSAARGSGYKSCLSHFLAESVP